MTKTIDEEIRCVGCGAVLQTENPTQRGYTPSGAFKKGLETGELYCQRCFKLRHYNELQKVTMSNDEFLTLLNKVGQEDALIVYVIDIFDVEGSWISGFHRFMGNNPVLLVANKMDLLPKSVKTGAVKHWLTQYAHEQGLRPEEVFLTSGQKVANIDELLNKINEMRKGRDVYVVGVTNVGKSTLINKILQSRGVSGEVITSSPYPGTTLDLIEIPLDDKNALYDTPGIIRQDQMTQFIEDKALAKVLPSKEVKARTYQLKAGQSIFIGGLARFDFLENQEPGSFTFYFSNDLNLHRTKTEGSDDFFEKHQGELLSPTYAEGIELKAKGYNVELDDQTDLMIAGLGWIHANQDSKVAIKLSRDVSVHIRPAII